MATEQKRLKLSLEEIFGILPVDEDEVEIERTPDLGNISSPNWDAPMKKFSLGLQNAKETVLSNMIAKKINNSPKLSDYLDFITTSQNMLFEFIYKLIDRILQRK